MKKNREFTHAHYFQSGKSQLSVYISRNYKGEMVINWPGCGDKTVDETLVFAHEMKEIALTVEQFALGREESSNPLMVELWQVQRDVNARQGSSFALGKILPNKKNMIYLFLFLWFCVSLFFGCCIVGEIKKHSK